MKSPTKFAYICLALVATGLTVLPSKTPAIAAVPVCSTGTITSIPFIGGTLTAVPVCTNSPTSYTYQWSRHTASSGTFTNIVNATNATYTPDASDVGYFFKVSVRGVNADGTSTTAALSSASLKILNISDADSDGKGDITTCSELFTQLVSSSSSFEIVSGATLDCTGVTQTPISGFTGSLNGNGTQITNINMSCAALYCAIFGFVAPSSVPSVIENFSVISPVIASTQSRVAVVVSQGSGAGVTLDRITITGGSISSSGTTTNGYYVGSILGYDPKGVITNSSSSASVSGTNYVGGIAGSLGDQNTSCTGSRPTATSLSFTGTVVGVSYVGGISGAFEPNNGGSNCKISQSSNSGSISSSGNSSSCYLGGITGQLWEARIDNTHNSGSIDPGSCTSYIGGIVGMMRSNLGTAVSLDAVWNTGPVGTGISGQVGGVAGYCEGGSTSVISRSYNIGAINGKNTSVSGGLAGVAGCAISNTFSNSSVSAGGGLIGSNYAIGAQKSYSVATSRPFISSTTSGSCTGSFWNSTIGTTAFSSCSGATGKSTTDMKLSTTYTSASWDFLGESVNGTNDYWAIDATVNDGYPFLVGVGVSSLSGGGSWVAPDTTPPTATWTTPSTPSSSRTLSYTLAFSESVSGIDTSDFNNDAGTATGCVFTPSASSGTSITVSVTCSSDGTVVARLATNAVADSANNNGPTSNSDASAVDIDTSSATTTTTTVPTSTSTTTAPATTTAPTTTTTTIPASTTTSTSTTSTTVPLGTVGINSWVIASSQDPATPGSRIVLTTTISCGRQMSTNSPPYYPSMYYLVNSPQRINGVYGRPTLSNDRRTATFTVTVTAPSKVGAYQMYAYGRDNPFGRTCTDSSFNFAASSIFTLVVGDAIETTTTEVAVSSTTSSTTSSTSAPTPTSNPAPVMQLDVTTDLVLPENTTDFVLSRDSLLAIAENLQITNGVIRIKTSDGVWRSQNIQDLSDFVMLLGNNSSSIEIEVLKEGSTTPVAYSVPISSNSGSALWPTQVLIIAAGLGTLWFFIFATKRRRKSEPQ